MPRYRITIEAEADALPPEGVEEIIMHDLLGIWMLHAATALIERQVDTGMLRLPIAVKVERITEGEQQEAEGWTSEQWQAAMSDEEIVEEPYTREEEDGENSHPSGV